MGSKFRDVASNELWSDYNAGGSGAGGAYLVGDEILRIDVAGCSERIILRPIIDFATPGASATAQWSIDGVEWDPCPYYDTVAGTLTQTGVFALGLNHPLILPDLGNFFRVIANTAGAFAVPAQPNLVAFMTEDDGINFFAGAASGGGAGGGAVTVANGADTAEGSTTDPATASGANTTVIGALRAIRDKLLGTLTTSVSNFPATQAVSSTDGALATIGTTTDAATASGANTSVIGALRAIRDKLLGTLSTTIAAGSAIIGKVGIDQTTPGTTNKVSIGNDGQITVLNSGINTGYYSSTLGTLTPGFNLLALDVRSQVKTSPSGSSDPLVGIQPAATTAAASSLVAKASQGNLYGINVVAGATAGFIMIFDATSLPANGTVQPKWVLPLAANTGYNGSPSGTNIGMAFANGIVVAFSSTGPFTLTASATAFIEASAR